MQRRHRVWNAVACEKNKKKVSAVTFSIREYFWCKGHVRSRLCDVLWFKRAAAFQEHAFHSVSFPTPWYRLSVEVLCSDCGPCMSSLSRSLCCSVCPDAWLHPAQIPSAYPCLLWRVNFVVCEHPIRRTVHLQAVLRFCHGFPLQPQQPDFY